MIENRLFSVVRDDWETGMVPVIARKQQKQLWTASVLLYVLRVAGGEVTRRPKHLLVVQYLACLHASFLGQS